MASSQIMEQHPHGTSTDILRQLRMANEQAWSTLGSLAEMMGDDELMYQSYEKVLSHNRMNSKALMTLGLACEKQNHFAKAADCYHLLVSANSSHGNAWSHLGYCYLMQNDLQNAYTAYQHALYYLPNAKEPKLWYGIGLLYDRYGSLEHAEEAFEAVLQMNCTEELYYEVRFRLGVIAKHRRQYDLARERLTAVLEQSASTELAAEIWAQIGHVYELTNELHLAKSSYLKVVEHNPKSSKAYQQLGWLHLKSQNDSEKAIEYLKKAVNADAKDGNAWYLLGRGCMAINDCEEAYHAYKQAVNCNPADPNVWCSLGVLFYQLSQYLDALDAYSRAINLNPNICEIWYNVGTLYDTCNQTNDAQDAYQKAAELGVDAEFIRARLNMLQAKQNGAETTTNPPGPSEPPITAPMGDDPANHGYGGGMPAPLLPRPATSREMSTMQRGGGGGGPAASVAQNAKQHPHNMPNSSQMTGGGRPLSSSSSIPSASMVIQAQQQQQREHPQRQGGRPLALNVGTLTKSGRPSGAPASAAMMQSLSSQQRMPPQHNTMTGQLPPHRGDGRGSFGGSSNAASAGDHQYHRHPTTTGHLPSSHDHPNHSPHRLAGLDAKVDQDTMQHRQQQQHDHRGRMIISSMGDGNPPPPHHHR